MKLKQHFVENRVSRVISNDDFGPVEVILADPMVG